MWTQRQTETPLSLPEIKQFSGCLRLWPSDYIHQATELIEFRMEEHKLYIRATVLTTQYKISGSAQGSCGLRTMSYITLPVLAPNKLYLSVFLPQVGHRIFEKHRVQAHVGSEEGHVTKHSSKRVETRLTLDEVVWIIPRRPAMRGKTGIRCGKSIHR